MSPVRCAVIGAGWWGTTAHVPALTRHPRAELLAIQTTDANSARKIAADFSVPHACETIDQVLAIADLDAVVISSTPNLHYAQAAAALERGLHVLVEKPMTFTAAEARRLVALAEQRRVHFLISCPWHYTSHAAEAQRLIQTGRLGQVKMISVLMTNFTLGLYKGLPWDAVFADSPTLQNAATPYVKPAQQSYSDPSIAGGGQIYCQFSHVGAYLGFLTGRRASEVFARFDTGGAEVDVHDVLNVKLDDGALVSIATTGATMLSDRQFEVRVFGTEGMILLELWKGKMQFHGLRGEVTRYPDIPESEVYPLFAPAENLVDVVLGEAANRSPASLGVVAMEIIDAACRSARENRNVLTSSNGMAL
ncbi:MAG TPA: Gfo/Idh/MocA family oxidoreductase [Tepidisphaeraceae bacterium]|nr:Gfo/Idh/MocA family oxidoreductase [Tepidisphaeraceae bacterium]